MAKLIYSAIVSLDGYIEDTNGKFDWAEPNQEAHRFINDLERTVGTYLFGRRMYETMKIWETDPSLAAVSPEMRDYAEMWQAADKIVYSKTLKDIPTNKTQIKRDFDPDTIRMLKKSGRQDIAIGGPGLAAHAFKSGLIDEIYLFVVPIIVGGGKQSLPNHIRLELTLREHRRFGNGMVFLHYQTKNKT